MSFVTRWKSILLVANIIKRSRLLGTYLLRGRPNKAVKYMELVYDHNGIPHVKFKKTKR
jgi:hypothetical protein